MARLDPMFYWGRPNPDYTGPTPASRHSVHQSAPGSDFDADPGEPGHDAEPMTLPEPVSRICDALTAAGGRPLVVGGAVRDHLLGSDPKDFDVEVHGLEADKVARVLTADGCRVDSVGVSFGVLLTTPPGSDEAVDVSLPRADSAPPGGGHRDVVTDVDPHMGITEASRRRDLTINAIAFDPATGQYLDPHGGMADLEDGVLRAVDHETFTEDPLRAMRLARFASRYEGFTIDPDTVEICRSMSPETLASERIAGELVGMLTRGKDIHAGITALHDIGWASEVTPSLDRRDEPLSAEALDRIRSDAAIPTEARLPLVATMVDTWYGRGDGDFCSRLGMGRAERRLAAIRPAAATDLLTASRYRRLLASHGVDHRVLDTLATGTGHSAAQAPWDGAPPPYRVTGQTLIDLGAKPGPDFARVLARFHDADDTGTPYTSADVAAALEIDPSIR